MRVETLRAGATMVRGRRGDLGLSQAARSGSVAWLTEAQVASRLGDLRTDAAAWLGRGFTGRFSLAGAQAKLALLWHEGRWGEPD